MQNLFGIREILFPSRCLGCRILSSGLCSNCKRSWELGNLHSSVEGVRVFSSLAYSAVTSHILLSAKEDGIKQGDDLLLCALLNSMNNLIAAGISRTALVPIPSRAQANRKRGRNFVLQLSERLGSIELLKVWDLLEHSRKIQDQSNLAPQERLRNLTGSMKIANRVKLGRQVILVDDLMTTGATLGEAVRTLKEGGVGVAGAITAFLALPIR